MSIRIGIVMDPISAIKVYKDSSFAMLLAAQSRGWELLYMEQRDLFQRDGRSHARVRRLQVRDQSHDWYKLSAGEEMPLAGLDVLLMRKDPPMDMEFLYTTYHLQRAEQEGLLVVNSPAALRDCNEKLFATWFPQCCPPTLVTCNPSQMREFIEQHDDVIVKPLDAMGGTLVFRVSARDPNTSVILETLTMNGLRTAMAQRFIPEITSGDKRILLIDGHPVPWGLARIPAPGETRGNLAAGARGEGVELSTRDLWICEQVGPELRRRGLLFVGIDVIGDYLTEINVTSPTCIRELDSLYDLNIAGELLDSIEKRLRTR